jgi:hypothetical protein
MEKLIFNPDKRVKNVLSHYVGSTKYPVYLCFDIINLTKLKLPNILRKFNN